MGNYDENKNKLLKTVIQLMKLIEKREIERIDAMKVSDFLYSVDNINNPIQKRKIRIYAKEIKEIFFDNRYDLNNEKIEMAYNYLQKIKNEIEINNVYISNNTDNLTRIEREKITNEIISEIEGKEISDNVRPEKRRIIYELSNSTVLLNKISYMMELIKNNNFDKIDPIVIRDFVQAYDTVNIDLRNELSSYVESVIDILMNKQNLNNENLNYVYTDLQEMVRRIKISLNNYYQTPGEKNKEKVDQIKLRRRLKEESKDIEEQYIEDAIFLSEQYDKNGERVYSDEWLLNNLMKENGVFNIASIADVIRTRGINEPDHKTPKI